MPHVIVEYTDNLGDDARISELPQAINKALMAQSGVFPTGDIHSCIIKLTEYRVADGKEDDAFVHITFKIAEGRTPEVEKVAYDVLFGTIKVHFVQASARRYPTLSMELTEFDEGGSYEHNNIHACFRKT